MKDRVRFAINTSHGNLGVDERPEDCGVDELVCLTGSAIGATSAYTERLDALLSWCAFLLPGAIELESVRNDALAQYAERRPLVVSQARH